MPDFDKVEEFIDVLHDVDGDDQILKAVKAKELLREGGDFLSNTLHDLTHDHKSPPKPSVPTPDYQESAFLSDKHETSLYQVTNREEKLPEVTKNSHLLKNIKYRIKGLNLSAEMKNINLTFFAGKRNGIGKTFQEGSIKSEVKAYYKVRKNGNGTIRAEYNINSPSSYQGVSIYRDNYSTGVQYNFSNKRGLVSAFSADTESSSAKIGFEGKYQNANIEAEAYFTTGENYSNPYFGVSGRISF